MKLQQAPVSQLDKTPFLTLKRNTQKDLTAGRQQKNSLAHSRTHEAKIILPLPITKLKPKKLQELNQLKSLNTFAQTIQNIHHNKTAYYDSFPFCDSIKKSLSDERRIVFFGLVSAFTLLHFAEREQVKKNTFISTEADFIKALKLMGGIQQPIEKMPTQASSKSIETALQIFKKSKQVNGFNAGYLCQRAGFSMATARQIITTLRKQGIIKLVARVGGGCGGWKYTLA
jgi:ribosomal protein S25